MYNSIMRLRILTIFIISSLLTIGVLGFWGLGSINHSGQHSCPIFLMLGGYCPSSEGGVALAVHHVSGIQNLTQSIIILDASLLVLLVLLVFATLLVVSKPPQGTSAPQLLSRQTRHRITESTLTPKKQFLRWLALHHKRDPHALQWVHDVA